MGKIIRNGIVYAGSPNVEVIDAYTKTESNSRFASKSIYGDRAIQLNSYSYSVSIGGNNREDYPFNGNVMIGIDNWIFGATYNNYIIGHNNEISKSVTSGDKNIVIGNYIDYQGEYGVAIGYDDKFMEVCPNGDVIVRGDVQCSDGSGSTVSMRTLNNKHIEYYQLILGQTITNTATVYTLYGGRKLSDYDLLIFQLGTAINDIRDTKIIPRTIWASGYSLKMVVLHGGSSGSASNWNVGDATITYNSDTSIKAVVGGSKVINVLRLYGIKLG